MSHKPTHFITLCKGADTGECPHSLGTYQQFSQRMEQSIEASGWPAFLLERHGGKHHFHHGLRIAVSSCPNGCSRPHVADIGLIRSQMPEVDEETCTGCGICADACPDKAILIDDGKGIAVIDRELCMNCGHCVRVCPEEAMLAKASGWRVLIGGRLGRHPSLGRELPGIYDDEGVLHILRRVLEIYMQCSEVGQRFGALLDGVEMSELTTATEEV